jgi:hypothetical protein
MEDFYSQWLKQNKKDNEVARQNLNSNKELRTDTQMDPNIPSQSVINTAAKEDLTTQSTSTNPKLQEELRTNIIYQNDKMQLYIEKGTHIHQIKFRLEDHLFYLKIKLIDKKSEPPLLRDILQFLEVAFNHVLNHIRKFYKPEDHNVAFLTLYQKPMISGLNTGNNLSCFFQCMIHSSAQR